jgi:hypothetical protein
MGVGCNLGGGEGGGGEGKEEEQQEEGLFRERSEDSYE